MKIVSSEEQRVELVQQIGNTGFQLSLDLRLVIFSSNNLQFLQKDLWLNLHSNPEYVYFGILWLFVSVSKKEIENKRKIISVSLSFFGFLMKEWKFFDGKLVMRSKSRKVQGKEGHAAVAVEAAEFRSKR